MPFPLTDDILALIVQQLCDDPDHNRNLLSLCQVAPNLVPHCQRVIFRELTFVPDKRQIQYDRTLRMARAISGSAHLGLYVRELEIRLPTKAPLRASPSEWEEVARALATMEAVFTLRITKGVSYEYSGAQAIAEYREIMPQEIHNVLGHVLRGAYLRRLSINGISGFPGDFVLGASQLEELVLDHTTISHDLGDLDSLRAAKPPAGCLQSLMCGGDYNGVDFLVDVALELGPSIGLKFTGLKELDVEVHVPYKAQERRTIDLIEGVDGLRRLNVTAHCSRGYHMNTSLLKNLNPGCFHSLTHLTLNFAFNVDNLYEPFSGDPYLGVCNSVLGKLEQLEVLEINLRFQVVTLFLGRPLHNRLGFSWGRLADVLVNPGVLPTLKRVRVEAKVSVDRDTLSELSVLPRYQHELVDDLNDVVFPEQRRRLDRLRREGDIVDVSFSAAAV